MAVLRKGQGIRILPRTAIRAREVELGYVHGLITQGWDPRPDATIIRFPVERRLASVNASSNNIS